jgi:hypothetical protein
MCYFCSCGDDNVPVDNTRFFAVSVDVTRADDGENHSGVVGMIQAYGMYFNYDSLKSRLKLQYGDSCLIKVLFIMEMDVTDFKDFMNNK